MTTQDTDYGSGRAGSDEAPESGHQITSTEPRPGWVALDAARALAFTGEIVFDAVPEVRVYLDNGVVYFAERADDDTLGRRLLAAGLVDASQLERGTVRVGTVEHLGRLFEREPSVDRDAVMVMTETSTQELVAELANHVIANSHATAYRHHESGVHRWFVAPTEGARVARPVGELPLVGSAVVEDLPGLPSAENGAQADELRIEWNEPVVAAAPTAESDDLDDDASLLEKILDDDLASIFSDSAEAEPAVVDESVAPFAEAEPAVVDESVAPFAEAVDSAVEIDDADADFTIVWPDGTEDVPTEYVGDPATDATPPYARRSTDRPIEDPTHVEPGAVAPEWTAVPEAEWAESPAASSPDDVSELAGLDIEWATEDADAAPEVVSEVVEPEAEWASEIVDDAPEVVSEVVEPEPEWASEIVDDAPDAVFDHFAEPEPEWAAEVDDAAPEVVSEVVEPEPEWAAEVSDDAPDAVFDHFAEPEAEWASEVSDDAPEVVSEFVEPEPEWAAEVDAAAPDAVFDHFVEDTVEVEPVVDDWVADAAEPEWTPDEPVATADPGAVIEPMVELEWTPDEPTGADVPTGEPDPADEVVTSTGGFERSAVDFEMPALVLDDLPPTDEDVPDEVSNAVLRAIRAIESASVTPQFGSGDPAEVAPEPTFAGFPPPTPETSVEALYAAQAAADGEAADMTVETDGESAGDQPAADTPAPRVASVVFVDDEPEPEPEDGSGDRAGALRRLINSIRRR